jgi:hypothetical protein
MDATDCQGRPYHKGSNSPILPAPNASAGTDQHTSSTANGSKKLDDSRMDGMAGEIGQKPSIRSALFTRGTCSSRSNKLQITIVVENGKPSLSHLGFGAATTIAVTPHLMVNDSLARELNYSLN